MKLTKEQEAEMRRVFPDGWREIDIPSFWRKEEEFNKEMDLIDEMERRAEEYEDIRFAERAELDVLRERER